MASSSDDGGKKKRGKKGAPSNGLQIGYDRCRGVVCGFFHFHRLSNLRLVSLTMHPLKYFGFSYSKCSSDCKVQSGSDNCIEIFLD